MADFSTVVVTQVTQAVTLHTVQQVVQVNSSVPGSYADVEAYARLYHGTGSPEGVVTSAVAGLYRQTDGINGNLLWVKNTGTGNTGWRLLNVQDSRANNQRFLTKLTQNIENVTMLLLSDSTGGPAYWTPTFYAGIAARFPAYTVKVRLWNLTGGVYDAPTTIQTGTGSNTLTIYSCSISGANTATFLSPTYNGLAGTFQGIVGVSPDYAIIAMGHNESATPPTQFNDAWMSQYLELVMSVLQACPDTEWCVVAQNPQTGNNYMGQRALAYAKIATAYGMGFIDVYQAFQENGGAAALTTDGVHPNATGSALWAATCLRPFLYTEAGTVVGGSFPWTMAGRERLLNGDFTRWPTGAAVPDHWIASSATVTKDLVNYEGPKTYGVKVTSSAAPTPSYIVQQVDALDLRGQWVTLAVRSRVAIGAASTAGIIGLYDGIGGSITNSRSRLSFFTQGYFRWVVWQYYVSTTATTLNVILYADAAGVVGGGEATFSYASLKVGRIPVVSADGGSVATSRLERGVLVGNGAWTVGGDDNTFTGWQLNGPGGTTRGVYWTTNFETTPATALRWGLDVQNAESGSDAGADLRLVAYDDTGTGITGGILTITRALGGLVTWARRLVAKRFISNGTALATTDFAVSAGWGTNPVLAVTGTDSAFRFSITAQATPGANPTVTFTFKDGTWTAFPEVVYTRGDTNATSGRWALSTRSATAPVFTFVGTPTAGETYILDAKCEGKQ